MSKSPKAKRNFKKPCLDEIEIKSKAAIKDKEGHHIVKGSVPQEESITSNMEVPTVMTPRNRSVINRPKRMNVDIYGTLMAHS